METLVLVQSIQEDGVTIYFVDVLPNSHSRYSGAYLDKVEAKQVAVAMFNSILKHRQRNRIF